MDLSDKLQVGIGAAAVVVGMQLVQNGREVAKSFSAYQHIVNGAEKLDMCREILKSEEGRALSAMDRKETARKLRHLDTQCHKLENEYQSLFSRVFQHSKGRDFSNVTTDLHTELLRKSKYALALKIEKEADEELKSSSQGDGAAVPAYGGQQV